MLSTLEAIAPTMPTLNNEGLIRNGLISRYKTSSGPTSDGLAGEEGSFTICTLWYIEALSLAGRFDPKLLFRARQMLDSLVLYANHVGLMSEEISRNGKLLVIIF